MSRDDDNYQDRLAAYAYLGGFMEYDKRGVPKTRYCTQDSREEKDCRAALARVLRSRDPLDHQLREMLAQLFEPDPGPETAWGIRKLTISFRANRRPRDHNANTHMAWFIWERVKSVQTSKAPFRRQWTNSKYHERGHTTFGVHIAASSRKSGVICRSVGK
jgi:hypothetical protein